MAFRRGVALPPSRMLAGSFIAQRFQRWECGITRVVDPPAAAEPFAMAITVGIVDDDRAGRRAAAVGRPRREFPARKRCGAGSDERRHDCSEHENEGLDTHRILPDNGDGMRRDENAVTLDRDIVLAGGREVIMHRCRLRPRMQFGHEKKAAGSIINAHCGAGLWV